MYISNRCDDASAAMSEPHNPSPRRV